MTSETCTLSSKDMERFHSYGVPVDAKVEKPSSNQTIFDRPRGMVAVYMEFFDKCGLRFPLTKFFRSCLIHYGVSITQLTPNSVKCMVGFEVLCRVANVEPSIALFGYFFHLIKSLPYWYSIRARTKPSPKLILNLPDSLVWKRKFVFIGEEMFPEKMAWKRTNNHYPKPDLEGKMLDEMLILSGFGVEWSILLSEKMLHSAKMPNVYSGPLPVKFCDKNGNEISKSAVDFLHEISTVESSVGKDVKPRKTLGGSTDTPSKRAKLSDGSIRVDDDDDDDDDDKVLSTIFEKISPQESSLATPSKSAATSDAAVAATSANAASTATLTKDKRIAAGEAAFAALEETISHLFEVKFEYKDADTALVAAQNLAEKHQQGLNAEVEKNRALQEALEKAKTEAEAARKEALKKNVALEEALDKAKSELAEARRETSNYRQIYMQKLEANLVLKESLKTAKRELDAEKKMSAVAREEAEKAKKSAAAAQQETDNLRSRIRDFYSQCCSKD